MSTISTISGATAIPSSYLSSETYASLSSAQQGASTGAQTLLSSREAILSSISGTTTPASSFSISTATSSPSSQAASVGTEIQRQSQESILAGLSSGASSGTGSFVPTTLYQMNLLNSLIQNGATGVLAGNGNTSPDLSSAVASRYASESSILSSISASA